MSNTKMKLLKQIGTLALCLCMIVSCLPVSAFAETDEGLCEHHHEHTAECGYVAAVEGQPCTHECGEECADGCTHEHDDACGYVVAVEGSPCKYECNENHGEEETTESTETSAPTYTAEEVKAMIDALPDVSELENMSEDEQSAVYEKAEEVYDAFETLTDEEQIELANDLEKLNAILEWFFSAEPIRANDRYKGFNVETYSGDIDGVTSLWISSAEVIDSKLTIKFGFLHDGNSYSQTYTTTAYSCTAKFDEVGARYKGSGFSVDFRISRDAGHYITSWTSAGSTQHTGICEICGETVTENHTGNATCSVSAPCSKCGESYINPDNHKLLDNGICGCGKTYQEAPLSDGVYQISNLGQLCWLAQKVNAQEITSHSAILTADITIDNSVVWVPISLADNSGSTFDGNNHTITFANTRDGSTFGLFANYNYSTIKNLYLAGSITCNQSGDTSALVNRAYSTTIQNVISTCTVNNSGTGNTGGLTGYFGGGTATIKNCAVYADVTGGGYAGGLIGSIWNGYQAIQNVSNCAYMGSVTGGNKAGALVGYNGNNSSKKSPFTDVYYCEKNGLGYLGATNGGTITATRLESVTADQFKSGEVAYKLNNGVTDGTQVWYQTCQSEAYPKFSGKTVYMGYICDSGNSDPVYRNSMDGLISVPSPEHKWDNGVCTNCGATQAAVWDETEQVYKISNLVQLQWFADKVNGGETSINGKLMADIDASSVSNLGIGTSSKKYAGTFDGNGYTINIKLNGSKCVALFPYVDGATIKNLTVKGYITASNQFAGSLVGTAEGNVTIEKCLSSVVITCTISGDGTHGGLVGLVNSGTMTMNYCGFVGEINGTNTTNCGGLVGYSTGKTSISNSFVAASFTLASGDNYTFSRKPENVSLTNCYYLNAFGTVNSGATQKSADQFASGEVAYLLNGKKDDGAWKQTLKTDATPNFSGESVYKIAPCGSEYTNNEAEKNREHSLGDSGCCTVCNKYIEIDTIEKLLNFAQRVNAGEYDLNAKLMADLDLTGQTWTPIAYLPMSDSATVGYTGIFDGNGHVISNITITAPTSATANGFFGIITTGTVKNLGINGLTFDNNDYDHRAGGIAGQLMSGGTIENCYVVNSTIKSSSHVVGGIVGLCKGTVKNCYTANLTLVGYNNRFGGITGDYNGGFIINCYTDRAALGSTTESVGTKDEQSQAGVSKTDFASGKITWLLNGNSSAGVWKQTLGKTGDSYPNFTGATVYKTAPCVSYTNAGAEKQHDYDANNVCKNCGTAVREEAVWNESEKVYEISNLSQLLWFADKVNGGDNTINGKLMNDIDASALKTFGIGTSENPYSGTFDGNGHTLIIALVGTSQFIAPFPYVNNATVKNLIVKGTIQTNNNKYGASLIGEVLGGTVTVEKCLSYVTITSTVNGDGTHGGLVGVVEKNTTLNIVNCGFVGAINGANTNNCGGLVGYSSGTTKIENSFVAANFGVKSDGSCTFARGNNITITNCYYLYALGTAQGDKKNADQFASGEVAWLLNGSKDNGTWKQTLGTDKTPSFTGGSVYKTTPCESYTNNESEKNRDHVNENGVCKYCGKLFDIVPAIWNDDKQAYEIYSAAQLVWFSKLVNGTLDGVAQNQSANAILMADIDMSAITDYVPIGGTTGLYYETEGDDKGYQGIFDGNGHVIKNLSVKGSDTSDLTYGVFGTLSGTVKHLGVENFTFTLGSKDCRAGGIAGQVLSGGLIEDCYVANSTITATSKVAGGIAGCNYAGTIKNCFTYKVAVTATRTGGIVGDNCGDNDSDRKGTIINCYTDASNIENSARGGIVTNSTASVSVNDFASGNIGFQLDYSRDLWKQTIGSHYYPTFSGDTIKVDGYNITGSVISANITWTAMEFIYTAGSGWDPTTHSYNGSGKGTWKAVDGGGTVTVENLGNQVFYTKFTYTSNLSGVTGTFDIGQTTVESKQSVTSKLTLTGTPNFQNAVLGRVDISISLNPIEYSWNVGDTVDWYGDDGQKYTCTVVSKNSSGYVLITKDHVKTMTGSYDNMASDVATAGARLPNAENSAELNFVQSKISKTNSITIAVWQPSKNRTVGYCWNTSYYPPQYGYLNNATYTHRIYYTFDVPIQ